MKKKETIILILLALTGSIFGQTCRINYIYGGDSNFPPYEYLNSEGKPEGFNIDVMKAIARETGIEIQFKLGKWADIRTGLEKTGSIDVSDMFYSPERDSSVDFSIPFTIAYDELFVRDNTTGIETLEDIRGKTVIVQNFSFIYDKIKKLYPGAKIIAVESEPAALQLLSEGEGDCAILSQTVTRNIFQERDYSNIKRVGSPFFPKEYAFVVKNGNAALLRIINKGLSTLKDKKILETIEQNWFGQNEEEFKNVRQFLTYLIYILFTLAAIVAAIVIWNRSLKKQVLRQTASLVDVHKKLTDTLENMDEGFYWVNRNWIITNINSQAEAIFEKKSEEVSGKNIWEAFPGVKKHLLPEYQKAIKTGKPVKIEFFHEKISRWFENRIVPSEEGIAVFVRDITEKKKAETTIKETASNLNSLIENWNEAVWAIDSDYTYLIFNDFYRNIFFKTYGISLEKGMSAIDKIFPERRDFWKEKYDRALSGEKVIFETNEEKNGSFEYYELFLNPIIVDNRIKGVSVFRINITETKLREIQLLEAKLSAERSEKLKTEFLAQISHEIRTPINNILNYSGLLVEVSANGDNEEDRMIVESIESSGRRIMRTIDLILNLSEAQLGTYNKIIRKIDLVKEIIKPVVDEYLPVAEKKNLSFDLFTAKENLIIEGDLYSLSHVMENLVDNAVKYTHSGGVKIEAQENANGKLLVIISDTGIGISEEFIPNLFEPFRQEEQGYTRSYDGNGIGLALVKRYCEINNVAIDIKSSKNSGTKITLQF